MWEGRRDKAWIHDLRQETGTWALESEGGKMGSGSLGLGSESLGLREEY